MSDQTTESSTPAAPQSATQRTDTEAEKWRTTQGRIHALTFGFVDLDFAHTLARELDAVTAERDEAKIWIETLRRLDSAKCPFCEHNQQYCWSPDGVGKKIMCLVCTYESQQREIEHLKRAECELLKGGDASEPKRSNAEAGIANSVDDVANKMGPAIAAPTSDPEARQSDTPRTEGGAVEAMTTIEEIKKYQGSSIQLRSELNLHIRFLLDTLAERDSLTVKLAEAQKDTKGSSIADITASINTLHKGKLYERCDASEAFQLRAEDDIRFLLDTIAQRDKEHEERRILLKAMSNLSDSHKAQRDTARAALMKYGHHQDPCLHGSLGVHTCTCGLTAALAQTWEENT